MLGSRTGTIPRSTDPTMTIKKGKKEIYLGLEKVAVTENATHDEETKWEWGMSVGCLAGRLFISRSKHCIAFVQFLFPSWAYLSFHVSSSAVSPLSSSLSTILHCHFRNHLSPMCPLTTPLSHMQQVCYTAPEVPSP